MGPIDFMLDHYVIVSRFLVWSSPSIAFLVQHFSNKRDVWTFISKEFCRKMFDIMEKNGVSNSNQKRQQYKMTETKETHHKIDLDLLL